MFGEFWRNYYLSIQSIQMHLKKNLGEKDKAMAEKDKEIAALKAEFERLKKKI